MPSAASRSSRRASSSMRVPFQRDQVAVERGEDLVESDTECRDGRIQRAIGRGLLGPVFLLDDRLALVLLDAHLDGDRDLETLAVADPLEAPDRAVDAQRR